MAVSALGRSTLIEGEVLQRFRARKSRIGFLHAGGPAPGGNEVFYAAALRAKDHGIPVTMFHNGFHYLVSGDAARVRAEGITRVEREQVRYLRNQSPLLIGTSRTNPGKKIKTPKDLGNKRKTANLMRVLNVFEALRIGALVQAGGDDSMRSGNLLQTLFEKLQRSGRKFRHFMGVVHVPKTIDKDYPGIAFTFGFMSAAEFIGRKIQGLHDDAKATATKNQPVYHIVEVMGRAAGWLSAASALIGQSNLTIVREDFEGREKIDLQEIVDLCVDMILTRRNRGEHYGAIVIAEGVGELIENKAQKDEFGHTRLDEVNIAEKIAVAVKVELRRRAKIKTIKVLSHKEGYAARQVKPNAFDLLLCQSLGVSAVNAVLLGKFGHMVSMEGVFSPKFVPFGDLVDPTTLRVRNWKMTPDEGLYQLMRAMEEPFDRNVLRRREAST